MRGYRGIEVGHVFFLGTAYSEPMRCHFLDEDGREQLFHFPAAMERREGPIHRLNNQVLVRLYEEDWLQLWD